MTEDHGAFKTIRVSSGPIYRFVMAFPTVAPVHHGVEIVLQR